MGQLFSSADGGESASSSSVLLKNIADQVDEQIQPHLQGTGVWASMVRAWTYTVSNDILRFQWMIVNPESLTVEPVKLCSFSMYQKDGTLHLGYRYPQMDVDFFHMQSMIPPWAYRREQWMHDPDLPLYLSRMIICILNRTYPDPPVQLRDDHDLNQMYVENRQKKEMAFNVYMDKSTHSFPELIDEQVFDWFLNLKYEPHDSSTTFVSIEQEWNRLLQMYPFVSSALWTDLDLLREHYNQYKRAVASWAHEESIVSPKCWESDEEYQQHRTQQPLNRRRECHIHGRQNPNAYYDRFRARYIPKHPRHATHVQRQSRERNYAVSGRITDICIRPNRF